MTLRVRTLEGKNDIYQARRIATLTSSGRVSTGSAFHDILSETHPDTTEASVVRGDIVTGQGASPKWARLAIGAATYIVGTSDGIDVSYLDPSTVLPIPPVAQNDLIIADATPAWSILTGPTAQYQRPESGAGAFVPAWTGNLGMADDSYIGVPAGGRLVFDSTPAPDQVEVTDADLVIATTAHGIIHVDGVAAGQFLRANGTRYVPDTIDVADITDLAYAVPNLTLGIANAIGAANSVIRTDATVAIFDAVVPDIIQCDDAAATGAAAIAARRDHTHGIVCAAPGADSVNVAASAEGAATSFARSDHTHNLDEAIIPTWTGKHTFTAASAIEIDMASGDPVIIFDTQGADKFTIGVDDDDSDIFKISGGGALGASDWLSIAADGDVGFRCNSAAANVEIEDGGTGNTVLLKITQDDSNTWGIMIGNDTASATDTHGLGLMCRDIGTGYVWAHSAGAENLILQPVGYATGNVGIMATDTSSLLGQLHIENVNGATQAVLSLRQLDVDEAFSRLWGESANGNLTYSLVEEGDQGSATLAGWERIYVQDASAQITAGYYYRPFYTLAA